jgi:hypothetical protein
MTILRGLARFGMVAALVAAGCDADVSPPHGPPAAAEPIVLSPDAELADEVAAAAARWAAATGRALELGDGGLPILAADAIPREDGTQARGETMMGQYSRIHRRAPDRARTVLHELGHLLGGDHVDTMGVLSYRRGYVAIIDGASLAAVCERLECLAFRPEQ